MSEALRLVLTALICLYSLYPCFQSSGADLFVAGDFTTIGVISFEGITRYSVSSNSWFIMAGLSGSVLAITPCGLPVLCVGGTFSTTSGANNIATWDGTSWTDLGNGFNGAVRGLYSYGGLVYGEGRR